MGHRHMRRRCCRGWRSSPTQRPPGMWAAHPWVRMCRASYGRPIVGGRCLVKLKVLSVALAALLVTLLVTPARAAAGLTEVTGFGSNPGALRMYSYVPSGLPAGAPLVVALHGCTQSASDYYGHSGWPKYADLYHAALVFPEQTTANNSLSCFNWFNAADIARGGGEALSVKQMVDYASAHYGSDPRRAYVTGLSAGGAKTAGH